MENHSKNSFSRELPVGWTVIIHVIDIRDHFDFLLLLIVDPVALDGEPETAVLFLHDYGAPSSIFLRLGHDHFVRLDSFQYLGLGMIRYSETIDADSNK